MRKSNCHFRLSAWGTWCSGITSASHAEGPGFKSQCVHFLCIPCIYLVELQCYDIIYTHRTLPHGKGVWRATGTYQILGTAELIFASSAFAAHGRGGPPTHSCGSSTLAAHGRGGPPTHGSAIFTPTCIVLDMNRRPHTMSNACSCGPTLLLCSKT